MFYGLVLVCLSNAIEYNSENCTLYNSPAVYDTIDECVIAIREFLSHDAFETIVAFDHDLINAECYNVIPESLQGKQL